MRRLLGTLLLVPLLMLGLAACGSEGEPTATDPETEPTSESTSETTPGGDDQAEATLVELVSGTAADGESSETLTEVDDEQALTAYVSQFRGDLGEKVRASVQATTGKHDSMYVGVVSVGCDVPPGVEIDQRPDEILVTPDKVKAPLQECLAPVTTVAVVAVG